MTAGLLVIMGSGETAPTMIKPHREIFARGGDAPAVLLDTPYGFQENADEISSKAVGYFAASVGRQIGVLSWRTPPPPGLARERALATLDGAGWLFAGPGSPTYALHQWVGTEFPDALCRVLERNGVVVFASAAALTLGSHTIPVYEIYKAGIEPHWVAGLDLVNRMTGLPAVVIPHFDNAEGGHHDTRFCYLGERRLAQLERELPPEAFVLGVDEHTGVLLDLAARTATVVGNGVVTVRQAGAIRTYGCGSVVPFAELEIGLSAGEALAVPEFEVPGEEDSQSPRGGPSLKWAAEEQQKRFDTALAARDVDGCVAATLDLEQVLHDWSADTFASDEGEFARGALRSRVVRLGELAVGGARDPREVVGGYVEAMLELRRRARDGKDYATSDWIRDRLGAAGVEVRDTPDGATWSI
jgi:cyanophycinase-like exopeptidase